VGSRARSLGHVPDTAGGPGAVLVEVKVQSLALDRSTNTPVVILQELGGERVLPLWIGPSEASAIAMQLADMEFSRPLTHDLLCSVLESLGGALQRVIITKVEKSTYYAELILQRNGDLFSLDARPSDSIAVALRVNARIFADDELLEAVSIDVTEDETMAGGERLERIEPDATMDADQLKEYLKGLNPEDFGRFTP
jgi:bifunctional DNase/RNase